MGCTIQKTLVCKYTRKMNKTLMATWLLKHRYSVKFESLLFGYIILSLLSKGLRPYVPQLSGLKYNNKNI